MDLTKISKFSRNGVSRETMFSIKGGHGGGGSSVYKETVVYDTCTLSNGDNQEDGDDPSFYNDPDQ